LPEFDHPSKTKTIVFDLDETLIHCVDDAENDNPDVVIPIQFSEEPEPVIAGINIRPHIHECLETANKFFQVIVFTASE
jgi:CTD small phosphatase-like protein 2